MLSMHAVIFGWKKDNLEDYLEDCEKIAKELTLNKFKIHTGGGGGFMLAGNKGCYNINHDNSYGVSVKSLYEKEGRKNIYYDKENFKICDTFSERKSKLIENKDLYIFFPGGIGTLDEFTELMNLFKTGSIESKPVILYGYKYWTSLKSWFEFNNMVFPEMYIDGIVNTVSEFNTLYGKLFNNKIIVKTPSSNEDIKLFDPIINKKNNLFIDNDGINKLIDEIFKDPIFQNEITTIMNNEDLLMPLIDEEDEGIDDDINEMLNDKSLYELLKSDDSEDNSEVEFIEIILEDMELDDDSSNNSEECSSDKSDSDESD